jgi:hypothetical protein
LSRPYSTLVKRVMFLSFLAVLVCAAPALATPTSSVTWNVDTTYNYGPYSGSITGYFTYAVPTNQFALTLPSAWDITIGGFEFTKTSVTANDPNDLLNTGITTENINGIPYYTFIEFTAHDTSNNEYYVSLEFDGKQDPLSGTGPIHLVDLHNDVQVSVGGAFAGAPADSYLTRSAVPLPPSAFLLVSGLIPLAWANRKKLLRK